MGRRGGGGRSPSPSARMGSRQSSSLATRPPPRPAPPAPAPHPPSQVGPVAQPQGPGLMAQMAATAGGVAIGSAIGHTVGHALTGAFSGGDDNAPAPAQDQYAQPAQQQPAYAQQQNQQQMSGPCSREIQEFLNCASNQHDITLCEGFNEVMKQCKQQYGNQGW